MKGDFISPAGESKKRYTAVRQQQGRVQLDADITDDAKPEGEKKEPASTPFQELVYLDVVPQKVAAAEDPTIGKTADGGPDTSVRKQKPTKRKTKQ